MIAAGGTYQFDIIDVNKKFYFALRGRWIETLLQFLAVHTLNKVSTNSTRTGNSINLLFSKETSEKRHKIKRFPHVFPANLFLIRDLLAVARGLPQA